MSKVKDLARIDEIAKKAKFKKGSALSLKLLTEKEVADILFLTREYSSEIHGIKKIERI